MSGFSSFDQRMMSRALELAALGRYTNHPNPRVGCVIVHDERIIGEGWHRKWGEPHAEVHALRGAGELARGATAYVTLEPHCFQGRTPPCTDALIRAGIKRVVCATLDPNPQVHGKGVEQLRSHGIEVDIGLLEEQARELNLGFEKRMRTGNPRVIVKIASSLDGRVALANGESRWITGEAARADVQKLRAESSAVLTGIETVLADDPQLNVRDPGIELMGRQPLRVVLDSRLRTPATARLFRSDGQTLVVTDPARVRDARELENAGAEVIGIPLDGTGRVDLGLVLAELGRRQCNDVLVEAGPTLSGRLLELGLADELIVYVAPLLLGQTGRPMALLPRFDRLEQALRFTLRDLRPLGPDVKLVLRPGPAGPAVTS
ncbi:MAG TPA: bifunctional diaminohydroxyphosphoribosylaminopyrimidine deaminase/5-amino-6-(5-phosphoribosylamino)uracil reductase RibD [Steroidobacteraceae bacterium]